MKRELKEGDVMYLESTKVELLNLNILQEDFNGVDSGTNEIGHGFGINDELVWFPKSIESLLSFTPYTIEDGVMNGYSYQRPWQPKQGEPVWVWDNGDQLLTFGVFDRMENEKYVVATHLKISTNVPTDLDPWNFCKPYVGNEINYSEVFK